MISSTPMPALPLTFDSPALLAVGLALGAVIITVAWTRRLPLPRTSLTLSIAGVLLLAVACGHPVWLARPARVVDVMVDLSPSTRGATYRDDATLRRRVGQLINNVPFRITCFSQVNRPDNGTIAPLEMPAEQTVFTPPANADAILLFSDGQFVLPDAAPPTYTVVDPALDDPADAAAERLEIRGDQLAATIRNRGTPREMTWDIGEARGAETIEDGSFVLPRPLPASATSVSVRLAPGDAWPENDALTLATPPPARAERWWIGAASAPAPWRAIAPAALSIDPAVYLAPAVIVLDNVAADDLSDLQQQRLQQYVRDLGGGVVILGGDRAFGAGGYVGSALDTISPLASSPPASTVHW
ncbi:MAG: hypothetical protein ACREIT_11385, partial [Tepidisphaeraceae bacterium]